MSHEQLSLFRWRSKSAGAVVCGKNPRIYSRNFAFEVYFCARRNQTLLVRFLGALSHRLSIVRWRTIWTISSSELVISRLVWFPPQLRRSVGSTNTGDSHLQVGSADRSQRLAHTESRAHEHGLPQDPELVLGVWSEYFPFVVALQSLDLNGLTFFVPPYFPLSPALLFGCFPPWRLLAMLQAKLPVEFGESGGTASAADPKTHRASH